MGRVNYSQRQVMLGANTSNLTGTPWLVQDAATLTISIQSSTGSASRYTVVGTNDDGLQSALGTPSQTAPAGGWSVVTTITSAGVYTIDPGVRWLNVFRDTISVSASSNVTVTLAMKVN